MTIRYRLTTTALIAAALNGPASGNEVRIEFVTLEERAGTWHVSVTLHHEDSGWDHYADQWRVVDEQDNLLAERVLFHPHVNEQPFTRSQSSVAIPATAERVFVEAHDKVHDCSPDRVEVNMTRSQGDRYRLVEE